MLFCILETLLRGLKYPTPTPPPVPPCLPLHVTVSLPSDGNQFSSFLTSFYLSPLSILSQKNLPVNFQTKHKFKKF